ncbi:MAG: WecB/TagA/CpsF family glycosyltransferase [Oscillospiraceae bacterium]|nr:WecB/TagA/CpsF family glycosyltransferase [Oscillospiraceae bacterium]
MSEREKISVLGVAFDNLTMDEAVAQAWELQSAHSGAYVVTPNPEIVMACRESADVRAAVSGAALTIADGVGIIYGAKILHTPLKQRLPGIDFTVRLLERMAAEERSVFILGGKPGVAEQAAEHLLSRFPGLRSGGVNDGYFQDSAPVVERINAAAPDLLLVCLGAPKQEQWMYANTAALDAGLLIGAGGSVDVFAGTTRRAPRLFQKLGLEWFYRLLREPWRFGRMMQLPKFLLCVIFKRDSTEK